MNYIILDLEWNTAMDRKSGKFINEIVEFGAVKLNEKLEEIDRFSCFVVSQLTKRLNGRVKRLTGISNDDMRSGLPFAEVSRQYCEWVGKNAVTMTWSNSDLYSLYDNYHSFMGLDHVPCIERYVDLQKYAQTMLTGQGNEIKNQISLSAAADLLGINYGDLSLHRAVDDGALGAEILRKLFDKKQLKEAIIDTSRHDYYRRLVFKPYIICDINHPKINQRVMERFLCDTCEKHAERISPWRFKGHSFRADFRCNRCGDTFIGCVTFKNFYDHVSMKKYKVRTKTPTHSS